MGFKLPAVFKYLQFIGKGLMQAQFGNTVAMHTAAQVTQVVDGFADEIFCIL